MSEPCMCGAYDCRRCFPGGFREPDEDEFLLNDEPIDLDGGDDEDEDLDGGYEPGDPKHSKYRETMEDRRDNERDEARERAGVQK